MDKVMTPRIKTVDLVVLSGWIALAVLGQSVLSIEVVALEILAVIWLLAGLLLVRPTACLPLLLLTCPVFMCEIQRKWAWVQWLAVVILLTRVLIENRFTLRQWLVTALSGTVVLALSWPRNAGDLLTGLMCNTGRELFQLWFHAEAISSMFPFREAFDRAMVATLCAALLMSGRYFSSHRIWHAFALCGFMVMVSALSASVLPWQTEHKFLGTTNCGQYEQFLFHGAGTNLSFFAILLAVGLPWWFIPLKTRWRAVLLGMSGFLFPLLLVQERALYLAVMVLFPAGIVWLLFSLAGQPRRVKVLKRWRLSAHGWTLAGSLCLVGCLVSACWYVTMGVLYESSMLRSELRLGAFARGKPQAASIQPEPVAPSAATAAISNVAPVTQPGPHKTGALIRRTVEESAHAQPSLLKQMEKWLSRHDAVRGPAWTLGLGHALKYYLWRGSGAGTWARFHRSQARPYREYYAHMHNTYLDLLFEYGIIPMLILFGLCALAFFRIVFGCCRLSRLWLIYLVAIAVMALGQHLFYSFTHLCLLIPAFLVCVRALRPGHRRSIQHPV